jgi:multidrug resistance efflux pump
MESTEKKRQGKWVVIGILLLAALGAGLTWMRYSAQAPSTTDARLISDRTIIATFSAHAARNIRQGTKAIVTIESSGGKKLLGAVESLQTAKQEATVVILLDEVPDGARPPTPCQVTVDTSVAAKALRD